MNTTSRVLVALAAVSLMTYGTALAQSPAEAPQAPAASASSPASPSAQSPSAAASLTATGELTKVDAKEKTLTIKTTTGDVIVKYDDDTKVTGASRNTSGLATMSGSQVMVSYKKDGASNVASNIVVKPAAAAPGAPGARPAPGIDRPAPGGDRPGGDRPSPDAPPSPRP